MLTTHSAISPRSFFVVTTLFTIGTSILLAPSGLAATAAQDAWLASIFGIALNLLLAGLYVALAERYPRQTIVQYCRSALGSWAGTVVATALVGYFILLCSLMIGDIGVFFASQIIEETPIEVSEIIFVIIVIYGLRLGLRVLSVASEIYILIGTVLFVFLLISLLSKYEFTLLQPMLEFGVKPIVEGGINFASLQELVVLLMIYPQVSGGRVRGHSLMLGMLVGGVVLIVVTLSSILVMGSALTATQFFPAYLLAKHVTIGQFFERLEGMMMFIWILTMYVKIAITFYAATLGLAQLFGISNERPFIWPLAIIMLVLSLVCYPDVLYITTVLDKLWPSFSYVFMALIPVLLMLAAMLRGHRAGNLTTK